MILQLDQALGCQPGGIYQNHDMKLIVNLISSDGGLSHEEANKAAASYKVRWTIQIPTRFRNNSNSGHRASGLLLLLMIFPKPSLVLRYIS